MGKSVSCDELPIYLFHQGTNYKAYELMGVTWTSKTSAIFRVWAPHARSISVVGDFNNWDNTANYLDRVNSQGLWQGELHNIAEYQQYKYCVIGANDEVLYKSDPYANYCEKSPNTASVLYKLGGHKWADSAWMKKRKKTNHQHGALNIYEMALDSWRMNEDGTPYTYRKIAEELVPYILDMGYTHIELLPVTEHPFGGSWGYQVTGYFAPTSRYGTPDDFMYLIDTLHQNNIGVIMDWVPAHFPKDAHGLYRFDGGCCYEYDDPQKGEHKTWGTHAFDYGRCEVESFLISSAHFWIEKFHIDGLRVDAVSSMLFLDFCREDGEWTPNIHGGRENLEAIALIKRLNSNILSNHPDVMMIAEESTSWPMVTQPDYLGGLGFTFKWNMGWMNDSLAYLKFDPVYRPFNHDKLTFALMYAFNENFILPISHDEVVHGKASLLNKMWGSYEQKFSAGRAFIGNMMAFPGKKLMFMGYEMGQFIEWDYERPLDWFLLDYPSHDSYKLYVKHINHLYLKTPSLWQLDHSWDGFKWLNADDNSRTVISYLRRDEDGNETAVISNFSPEYWSEYVVGMPENCTSAKVIMHSDWDVYGGATPTKEVTYRVVKGGCGYWNKIFKIDVPPFSTIHLEVRHKGDAKKETPTKAKKVIARVSRKKSVE